MAPHKPLDLTAIEMKARTERALWLAGFFGLRRKA